MRLSNNPVRAWPQIVHRLVYYQLIQFLEGRVYQKTNTPLAVVSRRVANHLDHYYGRTNQVYVVYKGFDLSRFNPCVRASLRPRARAAVGLAKNDFVLLLIGNGWKNKGLLCLLKSVGLLEDSRLVVFVAGRDNPAPYQAVIDRNQLGGRVHFLPPRPDVEFFYAAADAYVSPSIEDAFALPPAEAMACGLPVITSRNNGGSEMISHGLDGLILEDPEDIQTLAEWIRKLLDNTEFYSRLAANAVLTAQKFTCENSTSDIEVLFEQVRLSRRKKRSSQHESSPAKK
jgi:UDP-glucose:(heptosyl)LPS alpha-1,3-glucosyltransferase